MQSPSNQRHLPPTGKGLQYNLHFGIDLPRRQFILGFADKADAPPANVTWQAISTAFFIEKSRPFAYLSLTHDGNILGYDANGQEIYESNYAYFNQLKSKEDNSILGFLSNCVDMARMNPGGEMCVTLTCLTILVCRMGW